LEAPEFSKAPEIGDEAAVSLHSVAEEIYALSNLNKFLLKEIDHQAHLIDTLGE